MLFLVALQPSVSYAEQQLASKILDELEVKGRAPKTGFARTSFGSPWSDVDRNGCDTRNDILIRDLRSVVFQSQQNRCVVISGVLEDLYSGTKIDFVRGKSSSIAVQIDHVVALSNAWQTGAFGWSETKRRQFANDPLNLRAVKGSLNSQKGDGDAATWLPPNKSYRCTYVARQIAVKSRYQLWVTAPEKKAMEKILQSCPSELLPEN